MGPKPANRNAAEGTDAPQVVAVNRSVRRDFEVLDTIEVGIVLAGSEVKSLRAGTAQIADAHARVRNGELWLHGMHIPVWGTTGAHDRPDVERPRKLLAHRTEIQRFDARVAQERLTLVPTRLYFTKGRAKLELALVRARTKGDKRAAIAKRDADAEVRKAVGRTNKGMD